jgi:CheY-like chemotaxis protein
VLAEDNLPDALLVREAIRMTGLPLELHVVADGEEARDFFVKAIEDPNALHPDLLLLDLNLPKIDGLTLLGRLREQPEWKALPVMIITSSDAPADRTRAESLGASYFRKPVNYDAFLKIGPALKQFLEDHGLMKG